MTERSPQEGTKTWAWKVYASHGEVYTKEFDKVVVHARHRAEAKQLTWEAFDFEPDEIGCYPYSALEEQRRAEALEDIETAIGRGLVVAVIVGILSPLLRPRLDGDDDD